MPLDELISDQVGSVLMQNYVNRIFVIDLQDIKICLINGNGDCD